MFTFIYTFLVNLRPVLVFRFDSKIIFAVELKQPELYSRETFTTIPENKKIMTYKKIVQVSPIPKANEIR